MWNTETFTLVDFLGEKVIVSVHELTHYWTKPQSRAQKPSCSKSRVFHLKKTELERGGWQGIWVALESVMMHRIQTWRRWRRWQWMPNFILAETFCQIYIFSLFYSIYKSLHFAKLYISGNFLPNLYLRTFLWYL